VPVTLDGAAVSTARTLVFNFEGKKSSQQYRLCALLPGSVRWLDDFSDAVAITGLLVRPGATVQVSPPAAWCQAQSMACASVGLGSVRASNFTTSSPATLAPATTSACAFDFTSVFVQKQPYQLYQQPFAGGAATVPGVFVRMAGLAPSRWAPAARCVSTTRPVPAWSRATRSTGAAPAPAPSPPRPRRTTTSRWPWVPRAACWSWT